MGHLLTSRYLIAQSDPSIVYPGTTTPAFTSNSFFSECGKTAATGNISRYGCAICSVAMFIMRKGNLARNNDNIFNAVKQATMKATDNAADLVNSASFTARFGSKSIGVSFSMTTDSDAESRALNGKMCLFFMKQGAKTHYVLVDGYDNSQSNPLDGYLVADPAGGQLRTLRQAMANAGITQSMAYISSKRKID